MDQETWKLVIAHLSDETQEPTATMVREWLTKDPLHQQQLDQARWIWLATAEMPADEEWKESFKGISEAISELPQTAVKKKIFPWLAIAAVVTGLAIFIAFYQYRTISPAVQKESIVWLTKKAEAGKVLAIVLPDSSEIWLNSGSSLSFPKNMKASLTRTVRLNGEAFFKVRRDPAHPFIVQSQQIRTTVLGTSFNVNAWPERKTEVTVMTGKVAVSKEGKGTALLYLLPNQKAVYSQLKNQLSMEHVAETGEANAWIDGRMIFNQMPLESVFEIMERKYKVNIRTSHLFKGCKLTAKFGNISLAEVMATLEITLGIQYTIKGQTVFIKGGKCS
ncbi:ferric-dicitrate binding protein FerR, regulates iron transport through sigma-19 [Pedobacter steynii]|uniref:Ferric-dicitrate binding protein FerR, regulates iron transport through sigma-19 n=1 Tax=Pedobacter steynii TaxID=430522 RepID=A0A1H0AG81_9SPHI|nr:FecR family protein [Pedobacter steynii]NQX41373.1 FecR domain-containing protein [Pedobacter steynii]SDN32331.1 ferric-dicitrate binding protein FerR, regulates iron transport through sigma-19 [Pedobacter steynii]